MSKKIKIYKEDVGDSVLVNKLSTFLIKKKGTGLSKKNHKKYTKLINNSRELGLFPTSHKYTYISSQ